MRWAEAERTRSGTSTVASPGSVATIDAASDDLEVHSPVCKG